MERNKMTKREERIKLKRYRKTGGESEGDYQN